MSTQTARESCCNIEDWNVNHRMVVRMETPLCTEEQARTAISNYINRVGAHGIKWFMNYGTSRDRSYAGFILVWFGGNFEDAYKTYNLILGRNADGSIRYDYVSNPECEALEAEIESLIEQPTFSWPDVADLEDELDSKYDLKYQGPAIKPPVFRLNSEQSRKLQSRYGTFKVTPILTHTKSPGPNRNDKVLFAQRVPATLSTGFLRRKLNDMCHGTYSIVDSTIRSGRCLTVNFERAGDCNLFRTMFRVFLPNRSKTFLIFNYCFKNTHGNANTRTRTRTHTH